MGHKVCNPNILLKLLEVLQLRQEFLVIKQVISKLSEFHILNFLINRIELACKIFIREDLFPFFLDFFLPTRQQS